MIQIYGNLVCSLTLMRSWTGSKIRTNLTYYLQSYGPLQKLTNLDSCEHNNLSIYELILM